jgi:succinate dehydrogenase / fumarate reductase cytochrome b subunit
MAVTGLIGVGFVLGHMLGNLQMFQGPEKMNAYAYFLKHTMGGALWMVRGVLLGAVVLHAVAAYQLSRQRLAARPVAYRKGSQWEVSTVGSRTIRWGGALLLAFIVFHILHFTTLDIFRDYSETDVYGNVVKGFSKWWVVLFYVAAMAALGLHLYHGAWSSLRTIGAVKPSRNPLRHAGAAIVALIVTLGFLAVPLGVLFGVVDPTPTAAPTASASAPK